MNQNLNLGGEAFSPTGEATVGPHPLTIVFTGSGSEYFRIWIVNTLLMLITFGIYYPWAKVRRMRYFFSNTLVGGQPLDFHGDPTKILLGYFIMGILFSIYSAAGSASAFAGLLGFLVVAGAWPALLKSSLQFRLSNTSWRGSRFRFRGPMPDAYRAVLPMFAPAVLILIGVSLLTRFGDAGDPPDWYLAAFAIVMLGALAMFPWLYWKVKKFQHDNYAFATLQTTFTATPWLFYKLLFKFFGILFLVCVLPGLVLGLPLILMDMGADTNGNGDSSAKTAVQIALITGSMLAIPALLIFAKPYIVTRFQNLVWSHTVNDSISFSSDLRFRRFLGLTLKNWLLIVVTLGFYWPFAAIAIARMRVEAVSVSLRDNPDELVSEATSPQNNAAGDAGADLFGLDVGL